MDDNGQPTVIGEDLVPRGTGNDVVPIALQELVKEKSVDKFTRTDHTPVQGKKP